jgi:hypothetical protein
MLKENWQKFSFYLATQAKNAFQEMIKEVHSWELKKMTLRKALNIGLLLAGLGMGIFFQWGIMNTMIFMIFIGIILRPVSSQILALPALFFLILTPFALIFKLDALAENLAIYAYYFLILTVIMGIYEIRSEKSS